MHSHFLKKLDDENNLHTKEIWIELAKINNPLIEKKITQKGYSFLHPVILGNHENLEEVVTPLLLLCLEKNIPNKNEIISRWLAETLMQEKFTRNKKIINYRNYQQEKLLMYFIEKNETEMIDKVIYWSNEMPYHQEVLTFDDVRKYIFKNLSIDGLKNFSFSWGDNVWKHKWKFKKDSWLYEPHDFEANPESFWPIERQSLNFDWIKALLEAGCPTNMLMEGFFNSKEIETIMLRILKVAFYFSNHDYLKNNEGNKNVSIKNLWIRDETYLMKILSLFVSYGGKIEGSWEGVAWWKQWQSLRKEVKNWHEWNMQTLSYIDSFAQYHNLYNTGQNLMNKKELKTKNEKDYKRL